MGKEYEADDKKTFRLTRGMVLLAVIILVIVITVIIIVVNSINSKKPKYTTSDFKHLEARMEEETSTYLSQSNIVLTSSPIKVDLKMLLLENGGFIDSNKVKAAKVCDGYVLASKQETEKYKAYLKCQNFYTTEGYVADNIPSTTNTTNKDEEKPVITLIGEKELSITEGDNYVEQGAKAMDNVDGDITANVKISGSVNTVVPGTYTIVYTVSDKAGNSVEAKRVVTVSKKSPVTTTTKVKTTTKKVNSTAKPTTKKPVVTTQRITTPPTITLRGSSYVNINVGTKYRDDGYYAVDAKGADITSRVRVSGSVNTANAGTYVITYSVTDVYGNTASKSRTVVVKANYIKLQNISLTPNTVVLNIGKTQRIEVLYTPTNATNKTITWSSSNTSVATVSNGIITARKKGVATINAKTADGITRSVSVTVK